MPPPVDELLLPASPWFPRSVREPPLLLPDPLEPGVDAAYPLSLLELLGSRRLLELLWSRDELLDEPLMPSL